LLNWQIYDVNCLYVKTFGEEIPKHLMLHLQVQI